eukprot:m.165012 g.165012  ORF g.165012 m.165012 type:complete len:430 (-) comp18121_c0_seq3:329-1618(-)
MTSHVLWGLLMYSTLFTSVEFASALGSDPITVRPNLPRQPDMLEDNPGDALHTVLNDIVDWIMTIDVGSNNITHTSGIATSIFINGNLARVLLAAYKLNGNTTLLDEGLRWCDTFVSLQFPITTSEDQQGGYWDTGYKEVFIADTGTAVTTLAVCYSLTQSRAQKAAYADAMDKYTRFVTQGCVHAPTVPPVGTTVCPPKGMGWVIPQGSAGAGALGDGYYKDAINLKPYTISTATTGGCYFAEFDAITNETTSVAPNAVQWLVDSMLPDGRIPYIIDPPDTANVVYQPISYSTEAFIDVDMRYNDMHKTLPAALARTCQFLVANQSADGSWGVWREGLGRSRAGFDPRGDAQRSPRVVSLLQWCNLRSPHPVAGAQVAVAKYVSFIANATNRAAFGAGAPSFEALPTGFVGLAVADLIQFGVTFTPFQ